MLTWIIVLLLIAFLAGAFGAIGIERFALSLTRILIALFVIILIVALIFLFSRTNTPTPSPETQRERALESPK